MLIPEFHNEAVICVIIQLLCQYSKWSHQTEKKFRFPTCLSDILLTTDSCQSPKNMRGLPGTQFIHLIFFFSSHRTGTFHWVTLQRKQGQWVPVRTLQELSAVQDTLASPFLKSTCRWASSPSPPPCCQGPLSKAVARRCKSGCESWQWCLRVNATAVNQ